MLYIKEPKDFEVAPEATVTFLPVSSAYLSVVYQVAARVPRLASLMQQGY